MLTFQVRNNEKEIRREDAAVESDHGGAEVVK
jgi:hypothetical protein